MTVKQAFKKLQSEKSFLCRTPYNAMFDINFLNDSKMEDEVQFTITGTRSLNEICNELSELFSEFCKENNFKNNTVTSITYVGQDPDL